MQYSQEHLKTMVYAEFGGQTECIMGNSKIENECLEIWWKTAHFCLLNFSFQNHFVWEVISSIRHCFIAWWNSSKLVKNTPLRVVFSTLFSVFHWWWNTASHAWYITSNTNFWLLTVHFVTCADNHDIMSIKFYETEVPVMPDAKKDEDRSRIVPYASGAEPYRGSV